MKKFLFFIVLLAVMALVLIATCPDKATHHEAIKSVMSEVIIQNGFCRCTESCLYRRQGNGQAVLKGSIKGLSAKVGFT